MRSVTFLPHRQPPPSRGSCKMERDLLCCCRIPSVRIGEEVGGLGDMLVVFGVDGEEEEAAS